MDILNAFVSINYNFFVQHVTYSFEATHAPIYAIGTLVLGIMCKKSYFERCKPTKSQHKIYEEITTAGFAVLC